MKKGAALTRCTKQRGKTVLGCSAAGASSPGRGQYPHAPCSASSLLYFPIILYFLIILYFPTILYFPMTSTPCPSFLALPLPAWPA